MKKELTSEEIQAEWNAIPNQLLITAPDISVEEVMKLRTTLEPFTCGCGGDDETE